MPTTDIGALDVEPCIAGPGNGVDQSAAFGSYALWRIGITEDGEWRFFVAGD